jgi:hypothetical protein
MEPFVTLMRRYCVDYTARHDLSVCDDIMDPGYTLHMGVHDLAGRDEAYKPAAAAQFRQFPGLCLLGRRRQLAGGRPDPVEPPAIAPWDTRSVPADLAAEEVVRAWLDAGDLSRVTADDGRPPHRLIAPARTDISVLFSAGPRVAFHAVQHGPLTGEDPRFVGDGEAFVHMAEVTYVRADGTVVHTPETQL